MSAIYTTALDPTAPTSTTSRSPPPSTATIATTPPPPPRHPPRHNQPSTKPRTIHIGPVAAVGAPGRARGRVERGRPQPRPPGADAVEAAQRDAHAPAERPRAPGARGDELHDLQPLGKTDLTRHAPGSRVSAKSVYRGGRVIRSMARRGRGAMALVVAAMEAAGPWARRMRLMARFRRAAMTCGALPVRSRWRSSSKTTSRIQWRRFSMAQCPRAQEATSSGGASVMGREQNRVDHLDVLPPPDGCGASDPDHLGGAGEVDPGGRLDRFDGAPHPAPVGAVGDGHGRHVLPGQPLQLPLQAGPACP